MKRRVVLSLCLLGVVAGSAGAAVAAPTGNVNIDNHNVCIQFAQSGDYKHTKYICVDTP